MELSSPSEPGSNRAANSERSADGRLHSPIRIQGLIYEREESPAQPKPAEPETVSSPDRVTEIDAAIAAGRMHVSEAPGPTAVPPNLPPVALGRLAEQAELRPAAHEVSASLPPQSPVSEQAPTGNRYTPYYQQQQAEATYQPPASAEEQPVLAPNQHIEQSAWHSYVLDENGRPVEGAIQYGQGFNQERRQENLQASVTDAPQAIVVPPSDQPQQQPADAPLPGALNPSAATPSPAQPTQPPEPALPPGPPTHVDPQHMLPSTTKRGFWTPFVSPWFWLTLGVLLMIYFAASLFS